MKATRDMSARGHQIDIELEPHVGAAPLPTVARGYSHRVHSRSASWSFSRAAQRSAGTDLGSSLAALNPLQGVTSVLRELVGGQESDNSSPVTPRISRAASQVSLPLTRGPSYHDELSDSPPQTLDVRQAAMEADVDRARQHQQLQGNNEDQQNFIGFEISDGIRWLEHNAIFIILLLVKFAWYHRSGLMVILGMFGTYLHCNQTIRSQVSLKNRREKRVLTLVVLFLFANIYSVYYVFHEQQLHNCLIFQSPHFTVDLWNLLWCICVTDYIVRFATMAMKALVSACFLVILPSRKKGKYYMLLEFLSQFYRTLIPLPLWFRYLSNSHHSGAIFAIVITAAYLMIKGGIIFARGKELYGAVISFIQDPSYGTTPSKEDMRSTSNVCPICQEDFSGPVMLKCRHIFCENCVLQWFDRQSTCPLCRSTIASDPKWRDGSTATWPQLF